MKKAIVSNPLAALTGSKNCVTLSRIEDKEAAYAGYHRRAGHRAG